VLRLERIEGAVRGHFGEGGVDEVEQVVLPLSQEDANLAAGERPVSGSRHVSGR